MMTDDDQTATCAIREHGAAQKVAELSWLLSTAKERGVMVVAELGVHKGGCLWAWRQIGRSVLGVDLAEPDNAHGATVLRGSTHDIDLVRDAVAWSPRPRSPWRPAFDLVVIDADHSYGAAMADWCMWSRHAMMVAFHDILPHVDRRQSQVSDVWQAVKARAWEMGRMVQERCVPPCEWGGIGLVQTWPGCWAWDW